jgi:hypothetical protein
MFQQHFLEKEMIWECGSNLMFEGYFQMNRSTDVRDDWLSRCVLSFVLEEELLYENERKQFPDSPGWKELTTAYTEEWCDILSEYTSRSLTYTSDMLPAMASLAQLIQKERFGEYLAGHWVRDLFRQMC